jgi:hypothetical protein
MCPLAARRLARLARRAGRRFRRAARLQPTRFSPIPRAVSTRTAAAPSARRRAAKATRRGVDPSSARCDRSCRVPWVSLASPRARRPHHRAREGFPPFRVFRVHREPLFFEPAHRARELPAVAARLPNLAGALLVLPVGGSSLAPATARCPERSSGTRRDIDPLAKKSPCIV